MFNVNEDISARQQVKVDTYNSNKIRKKWVFARKLTNYRSLYGRNKCNVQFKIDH